MCYFARHLSLLFQWTIYYEIERYLEIVPMGPGGVGKQREPPKIIDLSRNSK